MSKLTELEALLAKATPLPWHWTKEDASVFALYGPKDDYHHVLWAQVCKACQERGGRCTAPSDEDQQLIVSAVNNLAKLIAVARAAKECYANEDDHLDVMQDMNNLADLGDALAALEEP